MYFYKTVLGTETNSPFLSPESLGLHGDSRTGNKMAPLSQLVYPKGQHWDIFLPLSVPGKMLWLCWAGHSTKHQVFTQMLPPFHGPVRAKSSFGGKKNVFSISGGQNSPSPTLRDSPKFSREHCNILKIKLILILFI